MFIFLVLIFFFLGFLGAHAAQCVHTHLCTSVRGSVDATASSHMPAQAMHLHDPCPPDHWSGKPRPGRTWQHMPCIRRNNNPSKMETTSVRARYLWPALGRERHFQSRMWLALERQHGRDHLENRILETGVARMSQAERA